MSTFNLPSANAIGSFVIKEFGGVDLWSSPDGVSPHRSPSCVNMIRDKNGSVRKRMGYEKISTFNFGGRINGACFFNSKNYIHAYDSMYCVDEKGYIEKLFGGLPDKKSIFITTPEILYVITGMGIFYINLSGEYGCLSDKGYVPTAIVSKTPSGGGTLYEDYNVIYPVWKEQFLADGDSTVYHLEKKNILDVVSVMIRDENGDFQRVDENLYSVNCEEGTVTFISAPKTPAVVGMDNVIIEVSIADGSMDMLLGCTVGVVFGANGKKDRLFLGGNPDHVGMDFYSASGDFSYFPHMNYSKLDGGEIKGYSVYNGSLYTHLSSENAKGKSVIVKRDGIEDENGKDVFVVSGEFSSPDAVSEKTMLSLDGEALFLSNDGVYGMTVSDVTDQQVCQLRSGYLGNSFGAFTDDEMKNSCAVIFGDFYLLAVGGKMFVLDGAKKSYFDGTPLCSFQYECYLWENIPARILWTGGKHLYFGDDEGYVYRFFNDVKSSASYMDDGKKVVCYFDTADIDDRVFFKKKTYVSISVKIGAFLNTGVKIYAKTDGRFHEKPVYDSMGRGRFFDFSAVDFESVSFSSNVSEVTLCGKIRIRNTDSVSFRIMNDKSEPFSLYAFGTEYVQKNNYIH